MANLGEILGGICRNCVRKGIVRKGGPIYGIYPYISVTPNGAFGAFGALGALGAFGALGASTASPLMLTGTRHLHGKMPPQPGGSTPSISTTTPIRSFTSQAHSGSL